MMMRRDRLFVSLMYWGDEANRETCVKDVIDVVKNLPRGRKNLQKPEHAEVNVVDVARRVRWQRMGKTGERRETRHLM